MVFFSPEKKNRLKRKRIISHYSEIQQSSRRQHSTESRVILWTVTFGRASSGTERLEPQLARGRLQKQGIWGAGVSGCPWRPHRPGLIGTQMVGGGVGLGDGACGYTLTVMTMWGWELGFFCRLNDWLLKQSHQLYICWFGHSDAENPRFIFPGH